MVSTAVTTFTLTLACVLPAQAAGTWETTLLGRDINRNAVAASDASAVYLYDTTLNVTWLRDANVNGVAQHGGAMSWAANLTTGSGVDTISDWRLPIMAANPNINESFDGTTSRGYNVPGSSSEMASLFFDTLGNKAYYNTLGEAQVGYGLTNTGSFQNMQSGVYWSGTYLASYPPADWYFNTSDGRQSAYLNYYQHYALAVRPGDVLAPVPELETYAMLLAGLAMVGAISRRRARAAAALAV